MYGQTAKKWLMRRVVVKDHLINIYIETPGSMLSMAKATSVLAETLDLKKTLVKLPGSEETQLAPISMRCVKFEIIGKSVSAHILPPPMTRMICRHTRKPASVYVDAGQIGSRGQTLGNETD
jgi:hypothetical protein